MWGVGGLLILDQKNSSALKRLKSIETTGYDEYTEDLIEHKLDKIEEFIEELETN